ncbi:MAG TPA: immunoglobulin domain-containing protein [Verrucomicrobiae bacterium]
MKSNETTPPRFSSCAAAYSVVVTNVAGAVTSAVATLTVWVPPTITVQPQSRTNIVGTTASFSVSAAGTMALSYQWRKNGTNLSGATLTTLTFANVQAGDAGNYTVVVTNVAAAVTSAVAVLTVWVPPTITAQPQSRTVFEGSSTTFTVAVSGTTPFDYQWFFGTQPLSGATNASLTLPNVQTNQAGSYGVAVRNVAGATNSETAQLQVYCYRQYSWTNTNEIRIRDLSTALPYPAVLSVAGLDGKVAKVTVTFFNLSHTWPADIDALLVGPHGQNTLLMANAGGDAVVGQTFTFDDDAPAPMPDWDYLVSGTYRPTAYGTNDVFVPPAPADPHGTVLATLNGTDPNGSWSLFVRDDVFKDSGRIANGWSLNLRVLHLARGLPSAPVRLLVSPASLLPDGRFQFVATGDPGHMLDVWASDDLVNWTLLGTVTNSSGNVAFSDPSTNLVKRFYRVLIGP